MIEVKVPSVGESISEVQISRWLKNEGDFVESGTDLVDLETEKASVQVPAPVSGYLRKIVKAKEEFATVGDVICMLEPAEKGAASASAPAPTATGGGTTPAEAMQTRVMPAAARVLADNQLNAADVKPSGPGGRLLKEDVVSHVAAQSKASVTAGVAPKQTPVLEMSKPETGNSSLSLPAGNHRVEEVKPMSMLRRTIASRLVQAQHTAALLTTFNEVDMQPVMALRTKYRDAFQENMVSSWASCRSLPKRLAKG